MRVLGVVPLYPPDSRVGAWIATHEFLTGLATAGHTVNVYRYLGPGTAEYEHEGVTVWPARASLDDLAREADVVVAHLGEDRRTGALAAQRHDRPLVVMVHGRTAGRPNLAGAALAVFNSEASKAWLRWSGPQIVAHPPLRVERYRTTPGDRVTLVNLAEDKGGGLFWLLTTAMHDTPFLGVRGGYGRQVIRRAENLEVIAKPTQNMRDDVYARTRVLLMPSRHEAWGMVGLEAMCSGIPVIAAPTPGLRESLGDAGIFVDRHDLPGWRKTIETLLHDPDAWQAASTAALARVDQLDPQADIDRFVTAVEALCAS